MVLWGNKKWETHWEMGCGVAAQRGNTSLWWCSPTAAGADTVAKQSLRTTALSCLRTRETNVHTQGLKTENPKRAHCSFFIQAERRHKPSYLWFRGIKFKGWALCVLFCFSLFFFFFSSYLFPEMPFSFWNGFFWFVGWMNGLSNCSIPSIFCSGWAILLLGRYWQTEGSTEKSTAAG